MKFMLMMNTPGGGPYQIAKWPPEAIAAHMQHMHRLNDELKAAGELVSAQGLTGPDQARLVRVSDSGTPVTDGVFPETKEFLAGFWIVEVGSPERAFAIAARVSSAPGPGGAPMQLPVEVREVMETL